MSTLLSALVTQVRTHLQELPSLATPAAPVITMGGVTGASTWTYKIEALNRNQTSIASAAGSTTTGNATLTNTNNNVVTWVAVPGASAYRIYRTVVATSPTTTGVIAIVGASALSFVDTGVAGDLSTAPTALTGGIFWTDPELLAIMTNGAKDCWGSILDTYGDHFITEDITHVTMVASTGTLTGIPTDVFRVQMIEPLDTTPAGSASQLQFMPKKYNHPDFQAARSMPAQSVTGGGIILYNVSGAGSPVGAPTIQVAPQITSTIALRFVYNPVLAALTLASTNPIPGESDMALVAYTVAFARAKEREDLSPDPNWIAVYATEKQSILVRITPRQDQELEVVDGLFADFWN